MPPHRRIWYTRQMSLSIRRRSTGATVSSAPRISRTRSDSQTRRPMSARRQSIRRPPRRGRPRASIRRRKSRRIMARGILVPPDRWRISIGHAAELCARIPLLLQIGERRSRLRAEIAPVALERDACVIADFAQSPEEWPEVEVSLPRRRAPRISDMDMGDQRAALLDDLQRLPLHRQMIAVGQQPDLGDIAIGEEAAALLERGQQVGFGAVEWIERQVKAVAIRLVLDQRQRLGELRLALLARKPVGDATRRADAKHDQHAAERPHRGEDTTQVTPQPFLIHIRADDDHILWQQAAEDLDLDRLARLRQRAADVPQRHLVPALGVQRARRKLDIIASGGDRRTDLIWGDHTSVAHGSLLDMIRRVLGWSVVSTND